jgi:hypothetical protein
VVDEPGDIAILVSVNAKCFTAILKEKMSMVDDKKFFASPFAYKF